MPRALRIQSAGFVHHVVTRGNDRQPIFNFPEDYHTYINLLEQARKKFPIKIYNFVLMSNYVHLLVEPTEHGALSKVMEHVSKEYAKYFNKQYDHVGHVFQGRFKSFLVQRERYFFACSRYIDLNPVKAGIAKDPAAYSYSGYAKLANGKVSILKLDSSAQYEDLGKNPAERQVAYRAIVHNISLQGEELDLLNRRAGILGDSEFKKKVRAEHGGGKKE